MSNLKDWQMQANLVMPKSWKNILEEEGRKLAIKINKNLTYLDLIRYVLKEKYPNLPDK